MGTERDDASPPIVVHMMAAGAIALIRPAIPRRPGVQRCTLVSYHTDRIIIYGSVSDRTTTTALVCFLVPTGSTGVSCGPAVTGAVFRCSCCIEMKVAAHVYHRRILQADLQLANATWRGHII
jgi:hypothetical protein